MKIWKFTVMVGGRQRLGGTPIDFEDSKQARYAKAHPETVADAPKEKAAPTPGGGEKV